MTDLTEHEEAYFKKMFDLYDTDKSGAIGLSELRNLSKHLGVEMDDKALLTSVRSIGITITDSEIDLAFPQFVKWLQHSGDSGDEFALLKAKITAQGKKALNNQQIARLKEVFEHFDADGSGFVTREELKAALTTCGEPMSDAEVDAMLKGYDDGDGQLNFKEFVAMMTGAPKPGAEEAPAAAASAPAADAAPAAEAAPAKAALEGDQKLVNESWAAVKDAFPLSEVAKIFYGELFTLAPALKDTLFAKVDMDTQGEKLMTTIDFACGFEPSLEGALIELGERHAGYGAVEAHYPVVGQALLTTLKKGLGDKFTAEVETAWTNVFGVIQSTMLKGHDTEKGKALAQEWAAKNAAPAEAA